MPCWSSAPATMLPNLWIENLEFLPGFLQQFLPLNQVFLHCCLVLAYHVEQSAHLPLSLPRGFPRAWREWKIQREHTP